MRPDSLENYGTHKPFLVTEDGNLYYQLLTQPVTDQGMLHGRSMSVCVLIPWEESDEYLARFIGYTEWDEGEKKLKRTLPLQNQWLPELWCDQFDLISHGAYPERDDFGSGQAWPRQDWAIYRLRFSRLPYEVKPDSEIANQDGAERFRYVSVRRSYLPRERRVSGFGFVYEDEGTWKQVPDETIFIPEHTVRIDVTWHQIPENAVPWDVIAEYMGCVNNSVINLMGMAFGTHKLLFRGLAETIERYMGPNGKWYYDLPYVFEYRPARYGWNGYTKPQIDANGERTYGRIRRAVPGVEAGEDLPLVYPEADFMQLFTPGGMPKFGQPGGGA